MRVINQAKSKKHTQQLLDFSDHTRTGISTLNSLNSFLQTQAHTDQFFPGRSQPAAAATTTTTAEQQQQQQQQRPTVVDLAATTPEAETTGGGALTPGY